jgi:hypothetical protein
MSPEKNESDSPTDPVELQKRLYGIIDYAEDAEVWYWNDGAHLPIASNGKPVPPTRAPDSPGLTDK